jgi:methyltransferase-like protein/trans-aconitate methyltransferase
MKKDSLSTDNQISYLSYSNYYSNPFYLRSLSKLCGIEAAPLESAKILELGCASGGNILPYAMKFPQAQIIGVDFSAVHIRSANDFKEQAGLSNIEFVHGDIVDVDFSFGQFDYIIVHDVYSWVSEITRTKILNICKENLSSNGLVYINYNTLPGWNSLATIREMALYHANNFESTSEKIAQIRLLLDFVKEAVQESNSAYSRLIIETVEMLKGKPDFSIAHDFLESNGQAFYFSRFIQDAGGNGLQYLVDAEVSKMYINNYSKVISDRLGEIDNVVRMEQYLDFIVNRAYRQTILCHDSLPINRNLELNAIVDFYFKMDLVADLDKGISYDNPDEEIKFYINNSREDVISTKNPILKTILETLSEQTQYLSFDDLIIRAKEKLVQWDTQEIESQAKISLMDLFLKGKIEIRSDLIVTNSNEIDSPKAWEYAVQQCIYLKQNIVTNIFFETVQLTLFEFYLIRYLDGENTREDILKSMLKHFKNGDLETNYGGKKVTSEEKLLGIISLAYIDAIEKLERQALLV